MDELPFAPFLVALECWRVVLDGTVQGRGNHAPEDASDSAYREAFRRQTAHYRDHAERTASAVQDVADTVRQAMFDMTAAAISAPFAAMGLEPAAPRKGA